MEWRGLGGLLTEAGGFLGYEKLKSIHRSEAWMEGVPKYITAPSPCS